MSGKKFGSSAVPGSEKTKSFRFSNDRLILYLFLFFPDRLVAMQHEMREEWGEAQEVLDSIIEEDEANSSARKRKIAIARWVALYVY